MTAVFSTQVMSLLLRTCGLASIANPLSPPLRSPQQRPQGHPAKSKFLAVAASFSLSLKNNQKKTKYVLPDGGAFVYSPPPVQAQRFKSRARTTTRKLREGS